MTLAMPLWFMLAASATFGALLGSFLNVCIYRIPRKVSVVFPPSSCPSCKNPIAFYDNIPVLAWLWLRGRCRHCREPISPRYPLIEALTAALFVLLAWRFGFTWQLLPAFYFGATMIVVTLIDFDAFLIPDIITIPGFFLGVAASLITPITLWDSLLGAVLGFAFLYAVGWGYEKATGVDGMGGGDIKFAAMLGAFLGWKGVLLTVFLASGVGAVVGAVMMAASRGGRRTMLPFGTFLAPVALVLYIWGETWIQAYLTWASGGR